MTTRYISIPVVFAVYTFVRDCERVRQTMVLTMKDIEELSGYYGYSNMVKKPEQNMKMQSFLALVNLFDLNVYDYFELKA
jgi:hypothetical protein